MFEPVHQCNLGVMTEGASDSPLLVVAQSPGAEEEREGRPLIGLSGKILWKHAGKVGIYRENVMILNACCQIPYGGPSQAAPSKEQLAECRPEFERLLASFTGKVILTMGGPALAAIMGWKTPAVDTNRGYLLRPIDVGGLKEKFQLQIGEFKAGKKCTECKGGGEILTTLEGYDRLVICEDCGGTGWSRRKGDPKYKTMTRLVPRALPRSIEWIIPTMHPASIHYNLYKTLPLFRADLSRAAEAITEGVSPLPIEFDEAPRVLDGAFAADVETTRAWDVITQMGMASRDGAWSALWTADAIRVSREMLTKPGVLKIAHNWGFDYERLLNEGIEVAPPLFDTMIGFAMLQPDLRMGLERIASIYLPLRPWKHLSQAQPTLYNASDAVIEYALHGPIKEDLEYTGMLPLFETVMETIPTLVRMKRNGLLVSRERVGAWRTKLMEEQLDLDEKWEDLAGAVNAHSPKELQGFLYGRLGLPPQRNKFKQLTVDDNALQKLMGKGQDELLTTLRRLRKVVKLRKTYSDVKLGDDGRVHPSYLPRAKEYEEGMPKGFAASGRLASSDPNIQNQPKEARLIFVPGVGYCFLEWDWKAAEVRVVAYVSGDRALLDALATGDVHEEVRKKLGCDRTRAKNVLFGTIYGAGPRTLADLLTRFGAPTTPREAGQLQRGLARSYPDLWRWRSRIVNEGQTDGYITNAFGRRRYFYWPSEQAPEMIDFIPQSTVADCLWHCLKPLDTAVSALGGKLAASVHDSVLLEIPDNENTIALVANTVETIMGREWPQVAPGFRLPGEFKISRTSWGEMETYKHGQ